MNPIASIFIAASLSLLLTACGGGGGAVVTTTPPPQTEAPDTENTEGDTGEDADNEEENADSGGSSTRRNPTPPPTCPPGQVGSPPDCMDPPPPPTPLEAAKAAEMVIATTIESSPITDFPDNIVSPAMGVSDGIATGAYEDIAKIETEVEKIKKALMDATEAQSALAAEAIRLDDAADDLKMKADTARSTADGFENTATAAEDARDSFQAEFDRQNTLIADDESAADDFDDEADQLETEDPIGNKAAIDTARMNADDLRAQADALRMSQAYMDLKNNLETAKADATAKRTEADAEDAKATKLENDFTKAEMAATNKDAEAVTAQQHVDEIDGIQGQRVSDLEGWKGLVGDDEDSTETQKAELVFSMLFTLSANPTSDVADLDNPDYHVFARADQPAGTMTFVDLYGEDNNFRSEKSFLTNNSVDTTIHTSAGLP